MNRRLRIALLIESSRSYGRNLLYGIAEYARIYGPWTFFYRERSIDDPLPAGLRRWRPDGIITHIVDPRICRRVCRLNVPTVDLYRYLNHPEIPKVLSTHDAIMRLAAEHLLLRGIRQFAYAGFRNVSFSDLRRKSAVDYLAKKGLSLDVFEDSSPRQSIGLALNEDWASWHTAELAKWLRALPKPVGLICCNDMRAYQVLEVCGELGIRVPDQVAVVGVDNDPLLCQLSNPPLTSVDPNSRKIGYEAAGVLHRSIEGSKPVPQVTLVPPAEVVSRQSTDVLAIADQDVIDAVRFIREHACERINVELLCNRAAISRRTLERWFDEYLGYSPSEEILRVRLSRVRELLRTTDLPLEEIGIHLRQELVSRFQDHLRTNPRRIPQSPAAGRRGRSRQLIAACAMSRYASENDADCHCDRKIF
jgi:LacI family transcriptional regulator